MLYIKKYCGGIDLRRGCFIRGFSVLYVMAYDPVIIAMRPFCSPISDVKFNTALDVRLYLMMRGTLSLCSSERTLLCFGIDIHSLFKNRDVGILRYFATLGEHISTIRAYNAVTESATYCLKECQNRNEN